MPNRDYEGEFRAFAKSRIPAHDYVAALVAKDIITELEERDPDLLRGWIDWRIQNTVTDYVQKMSVATRASSRFHDPRRLFREAADEFAETRDARVLKTFEAEYVVDDTNMRRRVRDLTPDDCRYISDSYRRSAHTATLEAAFFRALRKRLMESGRATVSDLFTPDEYDRMRMGYMSTGQAKS